MKYCNVIFNQNLNLNNDRGVRPYYRRMSDGNYIDGNKMYKFKTNISGLKQGDFVVVETAKGFSVAVFVRYDPILDGLKDDQIKYVVCKVDMELYNAEKKADQRKKEIQMEIQQRKAQIEERLMMEMLAEKDPVVADLLKEYESL